jgi:hypothetical protein
MRHACSSMHGNAHSSNLEPRARHGGVVDRQTGGVATRVPQPQPPPHHHTTLTIQQPHTPSHHSDRLQNQQEYRSWVVRPIPSESGHSGALIPLNNTNFILACFKASQGTRGRFGLKQTPPPARLSAPKSPLPRRRTPDVVCRVARPRSEPIEIGCDRPIG